MTQAPPKHSLTGPRSWFSLFYTHGAWLTIVAGVICVGTTLGSVVKYNAAAKFDRAGIVTQAQAVDRRIFHDSEGADQYHITYRFEVGGATVLRERDVTRGQYERATQGTTHTIRYLSDRPSTFETYVGETHDDAVRLQRVAGIAGMGSLIALWWVGRRVNRVILTRRYGHRTTVQVHAVTEAKNASGRGYLTWYIDDRRRGKSLMHPISRLRAIGVGAEINIYVRKGYSVWEGDVGPRNVDDSNLPKTPRD
jgi:hypothetical protein